MNKAGKGGKTPLCEAIEKGKEDVVWFLLELGADVGAELGVSVWVRLQLRWGLGGRRAPGAGKDPVVSRLYAVGDGQERSEG